MNKIITDNAKWRKNNKTKGRDRGQKNTVQLVFIRLSEKDSEEVTFELRNK